MVLRAQTKRGSTLVDDVSARIRANTLSLRENAEEGSVAISNVVVDDPDGDLDITGLLGFHFYETETPDPAGIYGGYTADRTISRGDDDSSFRTTVARRWDVSIADQNFIISRNIFPPSNTTANRPAELDTDRVTWLISQPEMDNFTDTTFVNTSGGVTMDAADYRGQTCFDTLNDCALASGKNFFAYLNSSAARGLWYDFADSTDYSSDIYISNDASEVDSSTVFAASFDTKLVRDPSRVFSSIYLPYDGGAVFETNATTAANFLARDTTAYSPNVKTSAKATARAIRMLADVATEEDRVTTTIMVPNAQVNDLKAGHRVQCKFTHLPGYEDYQWLRVLNRTVTQVSEYFYQITVELSGPGTPGEAPPQDCLAQDGNQYAFTPAGTYAPLGLSAPGPPSGDFAAADSTYFMAYIITIGGPGEYPNPGYPGGSEGGINQCSYSSGGVDYMSGGILGRVRFWLIGPGTLSVETAPHSGVGLNGIGSCAAVSTYMFLEAYEPVDSSLPILEDSDTGAPGDTLTVTIPDDDECAHYVDLGGDGTWGFAGATWTPA